MDNQNDKSNEGGDIMTELVYCNTCWKHIGSNIKAWGRTFEPCTCEVPTPDIQIGSKPKCNCEACFIGEPCFEGK